MSKHTEDLTDEQTTDAVAQTTDTVEDESRRDAAVSHSVTDTVTDTVTDSVTDDDDATDATAPEDTDGGADPEDTTDGDTFPRAYVDKLRQKSAGYRSRAREAETALEAVRKELHAARVASLGLLADPSDLPYDPEHLTSPEALQSAAEALLAERPHLRSRRVAGDIGQHTAPSSDGVSLLGLMRANA